MLLTDPNGVSLSLTARYHGSHLPPNYACPSKDVHFPILETYEYVTLFGKSNITTMMISRVLIWGGDPGLSR